MNERIKELAGQARLDIATNSVDMPIIVATRNGKLADPVETIERFAELLIKDCTTTMEQYLHMRVDPSMISSLVKKKYGFE
jgi:hypothetical protein